MLSTCKLYVRRYAVTDDIGSNIEEQRPYFETIQKKKGLPQTSFRKTIIRKYRY